MQSKRKSLFEATINTAAGLITSFLLQMFIYSLLNIEVKTSQNVIITLVFTVVSILRGYVIRRIFNK